MKDIDRIVELHMKLFTGENHIPVLFGPDYIYSMFKWLIMSNNTFILIAEIEKKVVGFVSVCDKPYSGKFFLSGFPSLVKSFTRKPVLLVSVSLWKRIINRILQSNLKVNQIDLSKMAQLHLIAVDVEFRGLGISGELLKNVENEIMTRGCNSIFAGVYRTNLPSQRTFKKAGWNEIKDERTYPTIIFYKVLVKPLISLKPEF